MYSVDPSQVFIEQLVKLKPEISRLLKERVKLAQQDPGRFKHLKHDRYNTFAIKFSEQRKEIDLFDRENDYRDLDALLEKCGF